MKKLLLSIMLISSSVFAGLEITEKSNSVSADWNGKPLWTFNHDPAEGKPYFHPLQSTDGTMFTDLRPKDHPWHRGVWFSWKFINGINYWEEDHQTGKSKGETRIVEVVRNVTAEKDVRLQLKLEYAPAESAAVVMQESRHVVVSAPDENGMYSIDWSSEFQALEKDVVLDRTPLPDETKGKNWGGYAGWSVRLNKDMRDGAFLNSEGIPGAHRKAAAWTLFNGPSGSSLLFMDHPANLNYPSKWYLAPNMPYFSPAVIHDGPHTLKAGESLKLRYRIIISPDSITQEQASQSWNEWIKARVAILSGANNHNWKKTTPVLEAILEESGKFDVDVVEDPEKLSRNFLSGYDVLLSNWNAFGKNKPAPWSEELKKTYVDFVRNGGGHVVVHAGSSSFYGWDDYHSICLATWKLKETGHKKPHTFEVRISNPSHPIVQGMENFQTTDELWFRPFVHPDAEIIAESFSITTGNWEPTALVGQFKKGRCFTLLLGHNVEYMRSEVFQRLLIDGTSWAVARQ
jgi:type 1 glutamine amidotransferase